ACPVIPCRCCSTRPSARPARPPTMRPAPRLALDWYPGRRATTRNAPGSTAAGGPPASCPSGSSARPEGSGSAYPSGLPRGRVRAEVETSQPVQHVRRHLVGGARFDFLRQKTPGFLVAEPGVVAVGVDRVTGNGPVVARALFRFVRQGAGNFR